MTSSAHTERHTPLKGTPRRRETEGRIGPVLARSGMAPFVNRGVQDGFYFYYWWTGPPVRLCALNRKEAVGGKIPPRLFCCTDGGPLPGTPARRQAIAQKGRQFMNRILLVGDERPVRILLKDLLIEEGYDVFGCQEPAGLDRLIEQTGPDLLVWHISPRYAEGLYWLQRVRENHPRLPAILFTDQPWLDLPPRWVSAHNYLVGSLNLGKLKRTVKRVLCNRGQERRLPCTTLSASDALAS